MLLLVWNNSTLFDRLPVMALLYLPYESGLVVVYRVLHIALGVLTSELAVLDLYWHILVEELKHVLVDGRVEVCPRG